MPLSTLLSSQRLPFLALRLLAVALLSWAGSAYYTLRVNPEVQHFKLAHRVTIAWAKKLAESYRSKTVVFGGSACEFAFDGERLLQKHGLPVANLGRGAGMGATVLTLAALDQTQRDDTLIMSMEPDLLTASLEPPSLGVQFSFAVSHPEWVLRPGLDAPPRPWLSALLELRPGGYHALTLLGKLTSGRPLYRYQAEELRPSGWLQTQVRLPIVALPIHRDPLSTEARQLLSALRVWCAQHNVRLAFSLPWTYAPADQALLFQRGHAAFLLEVSEFMPVLRDPRLGIYSVREHFADTPLHLTEEGAALRTDEFAEQVKTWKVWTREALRQRASQ
jgi:hypothetical protein